MIGWLAERYFAKETDRIVAIVREMPPAARRQVLTHLADKMGLATDVEAKGGSAFYLAIKEIAEEAQRERQNAVAFGARSFSEPKWCAPALVEQWAMAWLAMKQGRISKARFERVDAALWDLMNEALTPEDILKASNQSTPKLFISYRREDSAGDARSLYGALTRSFGDGNVFFDVSAIGAGEQFGVALQQALSESAVFIAVIGPDWLRLLHQRNARDDDYVKLEIETALRLGLATFPILLSRSGKVHAVPRAEELPPTVRNLFAHQTHIVSHERFERDVDDLVGAIKKKLRERASQRWMKSPDRAKSNDRGPRQRTGATPVEPVNAKDLTLGINNALKRFIAIDEDVFKASLWRAIGMSYIPLASHLRALGEIAIELDILEADAQRREGQTYAIVAAYTGRLRTAVLLLKAICAGLELNAQAKKGPGWAEYSALVKQYTEAKDAYCALGPDLNRFARDAIIIDRREREQTGNSG